MVVVKVEQDEEEKMFIFGFDNVFCNQIHGANEIDVFIFNVGRYPWAQL